MRSPLSSASLRANPRSTSPRPRHPRRARRQDHDQRELHQQHREAPGLLRDPGGISRAYVRLRLGHDLGQPLRPGGFRSPEPRSPGRHPGGAIPARRAIAFAAPRHADEFDMSVQVDCGAGPSARSGSPGAPSDITATAGARCPPHRHWTRRIRPGRDDDHRRPDASTEKRQQDTAIRRSARR